MCAVCLSLTSPQITEKEDKHQASKQNQISQEEEVNSELKNKEETTADDDNDAECKTNNEVTDEREGKDAKLDQERENGQKIHNSVKTPAKEIESEIDQETITQKVGSIEKKAGETPEAITDHQKISKNETLKNIEIKNIAADIKKEDNGASNKTSESIGCSITSNPPPAGSEHNDSLKDDHETQKPERRNSSEKDNPVKQ